MLNFNFLLDTADPTSMLPTFLIFGGAIALMYFMMLRPQKKQQKRMLR